MRRVSLFASSALLGCRLVAAPEPPVSDSALRIPGVFEAALPGTEARNSLRFIFHPHLGDLSRSDYLRIPVGLRYGVSRNLEVTGEVESYVAHGLGAIPLGQAWGLSQIHLGTKYRLPREFAGWEAVAGIDYLHPLGSPPAEVTDGLERIGPYVTFARTLEERPDLRVFFGVGANLVNRTETPGRLRRNQLGDDTARLTAGCVWHVGSYHYTLEADWETSDGIGGPQRGNVLSLRPGVVYEVPRGMVRGSRGQWLLGLGLRATQGPDGLDFGASAKVRVNFDFKRLFRGRRAR